MLRKINELIPEWCNDPDCPNYDKRLVDKGYGCPVCPPTPVKIPSNRQEMMSIYLRDEIGELNDK